MIKVLRVSFLSALCLLIIGFPLLLADWIESGMPVCTDLSPQMYARITSDGTGGAIIAWEDLRDGYYRLYAQRIDSHGNTQWTAGGVQVSDYGARQQNHMIEANGSGGSVVLAWEDNDLSETDIHYQILTSSGTPLLMPGNDVELCDYTGDQLAPRILYNDDDRIIITWYDNRTGDSDIYAQRVTPAGTQLWTINGEPIVDLGSNQLNPAIATGRGGESIIVFEDDRDTDLDIYAQRVDTAGVGEWGFNGIAVCTISGDQVEPQIVSDGKGAGAIVAWRDFRNATDYDIYAQRVDHSGTPLWTTDGIAICTASDDQRDIRIISDESGPSSGAIIVWVDDRYVFNGSDIFAQRIDASGTVQWTASGVRVCSASGNQTSVQVAPDGSGGAIITWSDYRNGSDWEIYAQRIDASGTLLWEADGVNLTVETNNQAQPQIICDASGPAIVAWKDYRNGNEDIYAQIVDSEGRVGYLPPIISSVADIPGDEGGLVRLTIDRTTWDDAQWYSHPAATYNVWRRVDDPLLLSAIEEGTYDPITGEVSREFLRAADFPPGTWEIIGSFAACQEEEYLYAAGTLADSTSSGIPWSVYLVSVHTTIPSLWYMGEPDSGYSVDNNAPDPPLGLAGEQSQSPEGLQLTWNPNTENDIWYYAVYRGTSETFIPGPGNIMATPTDVEWFDDSWEWEVDYWYKLSAVDIHGNESGYTVLGPIDITGVDALQVPSASYLRQNFPNPFNPQTTILFGLKSVSRVSLVIFDAAGRRVRSLLGEQLEAGTYEEDWDGRDDSGSKVASGIYFYCLVAGDFVQTRKMVLLR